MAKKATNITDKVLKGKYINPLTDFGFKLIFGTKKFLIVFLNAVLKIKGGIKDLKYANTEIKGISKDDRTTFYDLYCTTGNDENIIIEMQFRYQKNYRDRALFYASRLIQNQGLNKLGKDWDFKLTPVYSVNIVNFHITGKRKELPDGKKYTIDTLFDVLTFVFLELPRFTEQ
jgi:predicted transposase/invertase (TIGR01784 family)